jgi:hypothetical protein
MTDTTRRAIARTLERGLHTAHMGRLLDLQALAAQEGERHLGALVNAEIRRRREDPGRAPGHVYVDVATEQDFRRLSYYTLCRLQDTTAYADPIRGLPGAIARGEYRGRLTLDTLGNFIDFE